jgi:hypothetical protein
MKTKKWYFPLALMSILALSHVFGGGVDPYKDAVIVGVLPQHATRVEIIYRSKNGDTLTRSVHYTEIITDGKTTVDPRNYLSGYCKPNCKPYGVINRVESQGWPKVYWDDYHPLR